MNLQVIVVAVLLVVFVHCQQEYVDDSNSLGDDISKNSEGRASNSVYNYPSMYWLKPQTGNKQNTF